jgi:lipopolysaccharide/colanic/teichoic acid biosynthesis glycosyltransferase
MLKRTFDLALTIPSLIILLPFLALIALAIVLDSRGPVFYRGPRTGRNGREFRLFKFRSMVQDAAQQGPGITGAGDSRITRMGRFLRRSKLDELPQFINVLLGDMSLVGPRPEDPRYVALYTPDQREVLRVRPGITSPASVAYRNEEAILAGDNWHTRYIEEVMPAKLAIDLEYVQHGTLLTDVKILAQTFLALFR